MFIPNVYYLLFLRYHDLVLERIQNQTLFFKMFVVKVRTYITVIIFQTRGKLQQVNEIRVESNLHDAIYFIWNQWRKKGFCKALSLESLVLFQVGQLGYSDMVQNSGELFLKQQFSYLGYFKVLRVLYKVSVNQVWGRAMYANGRNLLCS